MKIPPPEKFVPKLFRVGLPYLIPILALTSFRLLLPVYICDDAYISFRTAHNLAEGNGMVVNPGEWIFVVTSPLWVLLLAGMRAVVHDTVLASVILGFFFEAILLISIVKFSNKLPNGRKTGMLAAVLLCSNPVFLLTSFSGMELALYLFAIVLTMYLLAEGRFTLGLTVAAVAVWIRFDGFLVYFAALTWSFWAQRGEIRSNSKVLLLRYLPSLALVAGYLLIGFLLFETMIPTSVLRKASLSPDVFSTQWFTGAFTISKEFLRSFVG